MTNEMEARRYDLDWLRVLAVVLLLFFHSARPFDTNSWHIKDTATSNALVVFIGFVDQFHMPLFFLLSGASAWFALISRTKEMFIYNRVLRLFVPMVCGAFLVVVPQMYFERLHRGAFEGSFLMFLPHVFDQAEGLDSFGVGNYHLWFLEYLFYLSVAVLPLFLYLRSDKGQAIIDQMGTLGEKSRMIFLLAVPLSVIEVTFRSRWPDNRGSFFYDWGNVFYYGLFVLYGYILAADGRLTHATARCWLLGLVLGAVSFALFGAVYLGILPLDRERGIGYVLMWSTHAFAAWSLIVAWLGLAQKHLRFTNSFLKYATEATLPVYILHQTVIVGVAFYVVRWHTFILGKYIIVLTVSLAITIGLYELAIKRFSPMRLMFGMRFRDKVRIREGSRVQGG